MRIDPLKQYARLREALVSEQAAIETRLAAINAVLETRGTSTSGLTFPTTATRALDTMAADYLETKLGGYSPRKGSLPAKILRALEKRGTAMEVKDISAAVKKKPLLVNQACLLLLKKGRLKREGRGQYSVSAP